jgi:hypothetical protein
VQAKNISDESCREEGRSYFISSSFSLQVLTLFEITGQGGCLFRHQSTRDPLDCVGGHCAYMETKCQNFYAMFIFSNFLRIQDSSVTVPMGYRLISGVSTPGRTKRFFLLLHRVQIHLLVLVGTRGSFLKGKAAGYKSDHSFIPLHGGLVTQLTTGKTLPFTIYPVYFQIQVKQCCVQNPCKDIYSG